MMTHEEINRFEKFPFGRDFKTRLGSIVDQGDIKTEVEGSRRKVSMQIRSHTGLNKLVNRVK